MNIDPKIIARAADAIDFRVHDYRVSSPEMVPYCDCGWRAEVAYDIAAYDRHIATAMLEAVADDLRAGGAVKALREAAEVMRGSKDIGHWNLRDPRNPNISCSPDVWLGKLADAIEAGQP